MSVGRCQELVWEKLGQVPGQPGGQPGWMPLKLVVQDSGQLGCSSPLPFQAPAARPLTPWWQAAHQTQIRVQTVRVRRHPCATLQQALHSNVSMTSPAHSTKGAALGSSLTQDLLQWSGEFVENFYTYKIG